MGVALLFFSNRVAEHVINYTDCLKYEPSSDRLTNITCADYIKENVNRNLHCQCKIDFELKEGFTGQVYMYYGLSNYYQNHRRYVKSRDDDQLLGVLSAEPSADCYPFQKVGEKGVVPCGAIANSLFNDTLKIKKKDSPNFIKVNNTGIAWPSDKEIKFRNPEGDLKQSEK